MWSDGGVGAMIRSPGPLDLNAIHELGRRLTLIPRASRLPVPVAWRVLSSMSWIASHNSFSRSDGGPKHNAFN
jgi:hypothetical protein